MIPSSTDQSLNRAMFLICSMSPSAAQSVELETYRQTAESDASTPQHILEETFLLLVKDLETIGLLVDVDYIEVLEDKESLFYFLSFVSYLLPNSLYTMLKNHSDLTVTLGHILEGSGDADETLIATYLSELGGLDGQTALVPDLTETVDRYFFMFKQTDIFTDYLRNLHQLALAEKMTPDSNDAEHEHYRLVIREQITRLMEATAQFADQPFFDDLMKLQDFIIKDLIAPTNFITYRYLFTTDRSSLPDDLIPLFDLRWYHYRVSHRWNAEYFKVRGLLPQAHERAMLYSFLYAVSPTRYEYQLAVEQQDKFMSKSPIEHLIVSLYTHPESNDHARQ